MSVKSSSSRASRRSSISVASARLTAAIKKAALLAEEEHQREIDELKLEELKIKQKRKSAERKLALAAVSAEEKALSDHGILEESMLTFVDSDEECKKSTKENKSIENWLEVQTVQSTQNEIINVQRPAVQAIANSGDDQFGMLQCIKAGQDQQRQLIEAIHLSKTELPIFDGNPLGYWHFVRAFEQSVDKCSIDDAAKLARLLQYCSGKARKTIECCVAMSPSAGYKRAKELLSERFGNDYLIAEAWISKLMERPSIKAQDREALLEFSDDVKGCTEILNAVKMTGEISSQSSLVKLVSKLPAYVQNRWKHFVYKIRQGENRSPSINDFSVFLEASAKEANDPVYGNLMTEQTMTTGKRISASSDVKGFTEHRQINSRGFATQIDKCILCDKSHSLSTCDEFMKMPMEERFTFVLDHKLCKNCLGSKHFAYRCTSSPCSVQGCGLKHNVLLHLNEKRIIHTNNENTAMNHVRDGTSVNHHADVMSSKLTSKCNMRKIALPIVPVKVKSADGSHWVNTYALLDSGSTNSFCSEHLVQELAIKGKAISLQLTTLEGTKNEIVSNAVQLVISDMDGQHEMLLPMVYTRSELHLSSNNIANSDEIKSYAHLRDIQLPKVDLREVKLLIGQDIPELLQPHEIRHGGRGQPYATRTQLGWTINGPLCLSNTYVTNVNYYVHAEDKLSDQLENFWKVDGYEMTAAEDRHMSRDDMCTVAMWEQSVVHREDMHYEMKIPFKFNDVSMPNNRQQAVGRLKLLGKRLSKDEQLKELYTRGIRDMIQKGYAERVDETKDGSGRVWYVPHHGVSHLSKPGKVRIVFDCSAKFKEASLNDCVFQGPDLTNTLVGVLQRFRQEEVAITADIEAMYHQIGVMEEDRDALRFLWWKNDKVGSEFECYRMTVQPFGGVWSPSCACFVLRKTARDNINFSAVARQTVAKNFYVDDCLKSVATEAEAAELMQELSQLLSRGGFKLIKWLSNSRQVLSTVREEDRSVSVKGLDIGREAMPNGRVLGIKWLVDADELGFDVNVDIKSPTRRGILSFISTIYDPLGFISPVILVAKRIIQELTRKRLGWDEVIVEPELSQWHAWVNELSELTGFKVPRCLKPHGFGRVVDTQLHHFSDASQTAYGVVSYIRYVSANGDVQTSLLCSKSRLAPLKMMTIPRLELCAAALAVQLDQSLKQELEVTVNSSHFWTDSMVVLRYINNNDKRFQTYVANRLTIIHQGSLPEQWHHVPTKLNVADDVSRGLHIADLISSVRWRKGPEFLRHEQSSWPETVLTVPHDTEDHLEVCKVKAFSNVIASSEMTATDKLIQKYSSWYNLKKAVAWMLRLKQMLKLKVSQSDKPNLDNKCSMSLSVDELKAAEQAIVLYVQHKCFQAEIVSLIKRGVVPNNSAIWKLSPVISSDGILRVGGRLNNASIPHAAQHQMIMPGYHHVAQLVTNWLHRSNGHCGREHLLSIVREKFWFTNARQLIRKELRACMVCKQRRAKPGQQKMADLPADRLVAGGCPFMNVGVDYFGPFEVKRGRSIVKWYGCVFTCLTIRAIHIEIAQSLDTNSFIQAVQRFIARRGKPEIIRSDNGTNFVGAKRELQAALSQWNQGVIEAYLKQKEIRWLFNPPGASHMGGVWERQIRTIRQILWSLSREQVMGEEGLSTLMCMTEAIINSRPITAVSDDPADLCALTPNHLLLFRNNVILPLDHMVRQDVYRKGWRQTQFLTDQFWKRWIAEYLPSLQIRGKWQKRHRNLAVGDLVLVLDEKNVRGDWPLGRVIETFAGNDGLVRTAVVRTRGTQLTRPITKLCLLEAAVETS